MAIERKLLVIGRHGQAPQRPEGGSYDRLVPGAVRDIATRAYALSQGTHFDAQRVMARHTNKDRTRVSALAALTGVARLHHPFDLPYDQEALEQHLSLERTAEYIAQADIGEDTRLNIRSPGVNMHIFKNPERGPAECMDYAISHPDTKEHEGQPIESYTSLRERVSAVVGDGVTRLLSQDKDLVVLIGHNTIIGYGMLAFFELSTNRPPMSFTEIGGPFDMGELACLHVYQHSRSGNVSEARFVRGPLSYELPSGSLGELIK